MPCFAEKITVKCYCYVTSYFYPKPSMSPRIRKEVDTSTYTGRFAIRLRTLREKAGLTVEELAEKSGIPRRTLFHWESGKRSPSIEQFPQLAESLGIEIQTLMPPK